MSFIGDVTKGKTYAPGWFLANNEDCTRTTKQITQSGAVTESDGTKYVPMGTVYPSNDGDAIGIVYEDVDVTSGDMPGSVVTKGEVIESRVKSISSEAKTALEALGFKFVAETAAVTRPY